MLEQLLQGLQGQVGKEVQEKAGVDSDMMSQIMQLAGGVATKEVGKEMMSGGLDTVMNLFSNNSNSSNANSLQTNITTGVVNSLVEKLGFDQGKASMITAIVIPAIMNLVTQKNNETPETDSSPLNSLFGGKEGGGIADMIGGFLK
ncbi:MAG: DUF937 domain-containing protein [Chitinophagales bacterium]